MKNISLDADGSVLYFYQNFLNATDAAQYLTILLDQIPWRNQDSTWEKQPRQVAWFSDKGEELSYAKVKLNSNQWIAPLSELRNRIILVPEVASYNNHTAIDSCLANLYANGDNFIGFHSDTPFSWGPRPLIASLTLGAARKFILVRKKAAKKAGSPTLVTDAADRFEIGKNAFNSR